MTARSGDGSTPGLILRRWQEEALPLALAALEERRNGVVVATTGAGKSVFLAALLLRWRAMHPASEGVVVVTTPTRKLVEQLSDTLAEHLGPGVVGRYYTRAKQHRREVVVCCNPSVPALVDALAGRVVGAWIADECHRTESDEMRTVQTEDDEGGDLDEARIEAVLRADRRLGLTATPFRSLAHERLSLFTEVVYRYPPADAKRDGVVVDWRPVPWTGEEKIPIDEACLQMIAALGRDRGPGVVNAATIADAEAYTGVLTRAGYRAEPIHSRMGRAAQEGAIGRLRDGELDMLVHVSMLVEGVDFPWLRWLCLRRPVNARVRFIQEVGRVLRSYPGKTEAVLLDPHGLFEQFQITYDAALGWEEPPAPGEADERKAAEEKDPKVKYTRQLGDVGRYIRYLWMALVAEGISTADVPMGGVGWRDHEVSPKQAAALHRLMKLRLRAAPDHAEAIAKVCRKAEELNKGAASDAMNLLLGLGKLASGTVWTPATPIAIPDDEAFNLSAPRDLRTFVAAAMSREGFAAGVVLQRGNVVWSAVRRREPRDTWASLTRTAVQIAVDKHGATDVVVSMDGMDRTPTRGSAAFTVVDTKQNPAMPRVWALLRGAEVRDGE